MIGLSLEAGAQSKMAIIRPVEPIRYENGDGKFKIYRI